MIEKSVDEAKSGMPVLRDMLLDSHQKEVIRLSMVAVASTCLGIPYKMGKCQEDYDAGVGQWRDLSKLPENLDCQGLVKGVCAKVGLKFPEGAQHQFDFTLVVLRPEPGDFVFFGHDRNINKIYHVGMVFNETEIIEARAHQEGSSFKTGEVILRPRENWEKYKDYAGYRAHPKLL